MEPIIICITIFFLILLIIAGIFYPLISKSISGSKRIQERLGAGSVKERRALTIDLMRKRRKLSDISWLDYIFRKIPFLQKIDNILQQSDLRYPLGVFLLTSCFLVFSAFMSVSYFTKNPLLPALAAVLTGIMPFFYIVYKKNKRIKNFQKQLPDALDMLSRSLKAGHSFASGIELVADEFGPPIGDEFGRIVDEINFGVSIKEALVRLTERMDVADLKFLVIAVAIQMESGGDLASILEKISSLIRGRFQLFDRVNTLSAEGRLSSKILIAVPLLLAFWFYMTQPSYMQILLYDPAGQLLIYISVSLMIVGVIVMKKMIKIKV